MEDMIQIKIAVEGMKAEIIKAFDVKQISGAIEKATIKAVDDFDMEAFIKQTVESVLCQARDNAIVELSTEYGSRWSDDLARIINTKITEALKE